MTRILTPLLAVAVLAAAFQIAPGRDAPKAEVKEEAAAAPANPIAEPVGRRPLVQLAILLDTSNSMDGLIDQAKQQLWRIVNEFIGAKRDGQTPVLQVALFEYGNDGLPADEGHIRLVLPLTDDLDKVSQQLFALKTNGGQEYCGQVIKAAVDRLKWSNEPDDLKVVFIAGNEPFTQGTVNYAQACKDAITRGIQINTIFCGNAAEGINGKWKDGAVLADGSFTSIDHNAQVVAIEAPQDAEIAKLGVEINKTFVAYGKNAEAGARNQAAQDSNSAGVSLQNSVQRALTKGSANYRNGTWCLVDAVYLNDMDITKIKEENLPENMKKMTMEQRKEYLAEKKKQRDEIAAKIKKLNDEREKYVAAERKKLAEAGEETFDKAVVESVRKQAQDKNFKFAK